MRVQGSRLLAVDPSLTCSGWALFEIKSQRLLAVGKIKPRTVVKLDWSRRMRDLHLKVEACLETLELNETDFLVCEAPTTMRDPRAALLVEQVRSMFETLARSRQVGVPGRLNPRTVQSEIMGLKGRQLARIQVKEVALRIASNLYGKQLKSLQLAKDANELSRHQDIVDALLVGVAAMARLNQAHKCGQEPPCLFEERRMRSLGSERRDWLKLSKRSSAA